MNASNTHTENLWRNSRPLLVGALSLLLLGLVSACDNADDGEPEVSADVISGVDTTTSDVGGTADPGSDTSGTESALCGFLEFNLDDQGGQAFVDLSTLTVVGAEPESYDFVMAKQHPAPIIYLADDVEGLNAGNAAPFTDVTVAPVDGYAFDGENPVIGRSYKEDDGRTGQMGFNVTGNVYVLRRADGTYAKLSLTYAAKGDIQFDVFHQPEVGSTDLTCAAE